MSSLKIKKSYNIAKLSTFKIGGKAEYFCTPESPYELMEANIFAKKNNLGKYIIGGGANILVADSGLKGLVISTKKLKKYSIEGSNIITESGISIKDLNRYALKSSLSGLEFSSGLPGSLGGAVYMNARAYGKEMSEIVDYVKIINLKNEIIKLSHKEINFTYKNSIFMHNPDFFIYEVALSLKKGDKKTIKCKYKEYLNDRKNKNQYDFPSAGCVFKNNYEKNIITGRLIDALGLKGYKIGGAEISMHHGNFIINKKNAKAGDVKKLIEYIEEQAKNKKGITLEREIKLLGF